MKTDWHCVHLTRTVGWEARDRGDDDLSEFSGLVAWCVSRSILSEDVADDILANADRQPGQAARALEDARALRGLTYDILTTVARGAPPTTEQIEGLNAYLERLLPARRVELDDTRVAWGWRRDPYRPEWLLAPLAWSLADLLVSDVVSRVKLCDGDGCGWIFVDASRNRSRRWCDMSDCGNRAKVRRFRERERGGAS